MYQDIPETLRSLIEPVVEEHDCELVDVELGQDRGNGLLRITVDSRDGDGRVSIDRCVGISREIETLLDGADAIPGAYRLEVSSPGLDRVLGREKDFSAVIGREVKLRTRRPIDGRKRFRGRLLSLKAAAASDESTSLEINVDGVVAVIPFDEVEKANAIYEFSSEDFSKKSKR